MGLVFRARDRASGGLVAVKLVRNARDAARFEREAGVLAGLDHPGIVRYVAHGVDGGTAYLAMEWLEGEDLGERLARSGLMLAESVRLAAVVAGALAHAHARGVVHRDIKPANLFLRGGDPEQVAVLDFGVARVAGDPRVMTGTGAVLGTPGYMAPEQARGERSVDGRADVFALGCVLFECLVGRPAFVGEHVMALLAKILFEDPPRARDVRPGVPPALDALVARMMAKDPALRPVDGAAALAAIDLAADPSRAPAHEPPTAITGGEQRLISVVMASHAGDAEEHAPTVTPDEVAQVNADLALALASHGGRVERLADGSLVAFLAGAGAAIDQAAAAARSALAIRAVLGDVPIAIATGRGDLGGALPVGEAVDRAGRLLRLGAPERAPGRVRSRPIHIDEMTRGLLDARFRVEDAGDGGHSLLGDVEVEEGARRLLGVATRCVGRERDLANLAAIFEECVTDRVAKVVVVTAPAGTGKSRLCHELLQRLRREGGAGAVVWSARGAAISAGSPFAMLAQLVKRAAGVMDAEPRTSWGAKIRAHVEARAPGAEAARIAEFLGEIVGAGDPGAAGASALLRAAREDAAIMGEQLRRAFVDLVAAECPIRPLVLVLEDLHWGDLPTVKAIDGAVRALRDQSILVLALARPEVHDVFPRLWEGRDALTIRLGGLPRRAAEALAAEVLGEAASTATVARIVERADGNAFYLEELIRAVAEGRGDVLPETVVAMMQTRLEGLDPDLRRLLRAASVYGEVFWTGGVQALVGGDAAARLAERLAELVERELIARRGEGRFRGEVEHVFRHAIVREAAYAMLTDRDQTTGHRLAAGWLEAAGERDALILAEHFERGGQPARAVPWYLRAAESALEGGDLDAAIHRAESGLAGGAGGETCGRLHFVVMEARGWKGQMSEAMAAGLAAIPLLRAGSPTWYAVIGGAALACFYMDRDADFEMFVSLLERHGADGEITRLGVLGRALAVMALVQAGRYDRVPALLEVLEAIDRADPTPEPSNLGWSRWVRSHRSAVIDGDLAAALELAEGSVVEFRKAGDPSGLTLALSYQGWCLGGLGAFEQAEQVLGEAAAMGAQTGLRLFGLTAKLFLAVPLAHRGEVLSALALLEEVQRSCAKSGLRTIEGFAQRALAQGCLLAGDLDGALLRVDRAMRLTVGAVPFHAETLAVLARVRARRGEHAAALEAALDAMAIVDRLGSVGPGEATVRLTHVEALFAVGHDAAALAALGAARDVVAARAEKIRDPARRRTFLEQVHAHRKILVLARKHLGHPPGG